MSAHTVTVIHVVEWIGQATVEADSVEEARRMVVRSRPEIEWSKHADYCRIPHPSELRRDLAVGGSGV